MTFLRKKRLLLFLLLPIGALLLYGSSEVPTVVEKFYSRGIYRVIVQGLSLATGILPFSLAETGLIILVILFMWKLVKNVLMLIKGQGFKKGIIFNFLSRLLVAAGVIYFAFVVLWGFNYSRISFASTIGLEVQPASVDELAGLCEKLATRANELRRTMNEDSRGVMRLNGTRYEALRRAYKGYEKASEVYPQLGGRYGNPKGIILSDLMGYTGTAGIYSPFTGEANVNMAMPDCMIPNTACHEMAHQRGYAREDEANYIAYVACEFHPDNDFNYSGVLLGLIYAANALYDIDPERYAEIRQEYDPGVVRDLDDIRRFWEKYEGTVERVSDNLNNAYLKANMQKDGAASYGRMVDFLLAEYIKETRK